MALASLLMGALKGTGSMAATMGKGIVGGVGGAARAGVGAGRGVGDVLSYITGRTGKLIDLETARTIKTQGNALRITASDRAQQTFYNTVRRGRSEFAAQPRILSQREQAAYNFDVAGGRVRGPITNTQGLQDAMASRARARSLIGRRLLPAAGFVGAGMMAGSYIENRAQERRAYYGQEGYTARYGTSADTAASIARGAGYFLGAQTLMGINPFQGAARLGSRVVNTAKFRARTAAARSRLEGAERFGAMRNAVRAERAANPIVRPRGRFKNLDDGELRRSQFNPGDPYNKGSSLSDRLLHKRHTEAHDYATRRVQSHIRGTQPHMTGTGRPSRRQAAVNTERRARQRERTKQEIYDEAYRRRASAISARETQQAEFAAFRTKTRQAVKERMSSLAQQRATSALNMKMPMTDPAVQSRIARIDKRTAKESMQIAGFNLNVFGRGAVATALAGTGAAYVASNPIGTAVVTGGLAGIMKGGFIVKHRVPIAAAGVAIGAGAAIGMNVPAPAAAEGQIESIQYDRQSPIQKLNYSTAGIVQSIHNNRSRRM